MVHNTTVAIAVGLGVGIPVLISVGVLVWVTVRHRQKISEEDQAHEKIDFNGDVSFYDTGTPQGATDTIYDQSSDFGSRKNSAFTTEATYAPSLRSASAVNSVANNSAGIPEDTAVPLSMYAPSIDGTRDVRTLSSQLNSVYGPSPVYPSTEKLRSQTGSTSSFNTSSNHLNSPRAPNWQYNGGPFATPPRHGSRERRWSSNSAGQSVSSSVADSDTYAPIGSQETKESHHPYAEMAGETSLTADNESSTHPLPDVPLKQLAAEEREKGKHLYHLQAENRQSIFEY